MKRASAGVLLCLTASAGLFFGTANPVLHVPFAILLYPFALCLASRFPSPFRLGWLCGIPGAAAALYWIACAAWRYGGMPWALAAPCAILLGIYVALWGGLFSWLLARFSGAGSWCRSMAAGALWFLLEWGRGWFCSGFPWLTLSSGLAAWPLLMQPLCLLGACGFSAVLAAAACLMAEGMGIGRGADAGPGAGKAWRRIAAGALVCLSAAVFGAWRMHGFADSGEAVTLALIQGNVPQDVKWTPQFQQSALEKYMRLSTECLRRTLQGGPEAVPDLFIWPETAMPFYYPSSPQVPSLRGFVREAGIPVLTGILSVRRLPDGRSPLLNRASLFFPDGGEAHYDKEHLVPFGEYLPPFLDIDLFRPLLQGLGGFAAGEHALLFEPDRKGRAPVRMGMLICYEAIFPEMARQRVADGARVLLNISNDAWYDRTSAPEQHLHLAAMRAVEQDRWLARATNTGITAFVDPLGRLHALRDDSGGYRLFAEGHLTGKVHARDGRTLYFHLHPWLPAAALVLLLLCAARGGVLTAGRSRKG